MIFKKNGDNIDMLHIVIRLVTIFSNEFALSLLKKYLRFKDKMGFSNESNEFSLYYPQLCPIYEASRYFVTYYYEYIY